MTTITIQIDETPTIAVCIEGVERPTKDQAIALRDIAYLVDNRRQELLQQPDTTHAD